MTIRSTSGISVSVCQTVIGAMPEILVSAAIMSRSRLRPGSWTTADFMGAVQTLLVLLRVHAIPDGFQCAQGVHRALSAHCRCYGCLAAQKSLCREPRQFPPEARVGLA